MNPYMSTPIDVQITRTRVNNSNTLIRNPVLHSFMRETLQEYVRRVMLEKGLSGYTVERDSGSQISQSQVNRIQNGEVSNPSATKLKALAKGLSVSESELFAVARGITEDAGVIAHERLQTIGFAYENMPKKKKAKADYLIDMLEREIARIENEPE